MITIKKSQTTDKDRWTALIDDLDYVVYRDGFVVAYILAPSERQELSQENYSTTQWSLVPNRSTQDCRFAKFPKFDTAEAIIAYAKLLPVSEYIE